MKFNNPKNQLKTNLNLLLGHPVSHSLSPKMHTAAYEKYNLSHHYDLLDLEQCDLKEFFEAFKNNNKNILELFLKRKNKFKTTKVGFFEKENWFLNGLGVTIPYKTEVIKYLDVLDERAAAIGSVNTIINLNGKLIGYNTDWLGTLIPLQNKMFLQTEKSNLKALLLGAGGAAAGMLAAVLNLGYKVDVYNRTFQKSLDLLAKFKKIDQSYSITVLEEIDLGANYDLILNSTSLGMGQNENVSAAPANLFRQKQIVFEAVYKPKFTKMLEFAKQAGAEIIFGKEMLIWQGVYQFLIHTRALEGRLDFSLEFTSKLFDKETEVLKPEYLEIANIFEKALN